MCAIRPDRASSVSVGVSDGLTTVTTAPASSRLSTLRSASAPPPSTTTGRPASSTKSGKSATVHSTPAGKSPPAGSRATAGADAAAHAEVVGVDEGAVDLDLLALDPDVGDPVLPARVRAARHVQLQMR